MTGIDDSERLTFEDMFTTKGKDAPPRHLGSRFDTAGKFLPQPGNTVVRQVIPGSATDAALRRLREALIALPHGDRFAYTPPRSYHMTVFEGVMDDRRKPGLWPAGVSYEATIEDTTTLYVERLETLPKLPAFDMKVARITPLGLSLTGLTPEDDRVAREVRDRLTQPFGYRSPTHDAYRFHTTLAYVKDWLPEGASDIYLPALRRLTEAFADEIRVMNLAPPALCSFEDMNWFEPRLFL